MNDRVRSCWILLLIGAVENAYSFSIGPANIPISQCQRRNSPTTNLFLGPESSSLVEAVSKASNIPRALSLGGVPALGMALTTLAGLKIRTPPAVVGALQHFSAGILLTTVAKELLPEMVQAEGLAQNLASGTGFFAGVGLLIGLGQVLKEESETEDEEPTEKSVKATTAYRLRNRSMSRQKEAFVLGEGIGDTLSQSKYSSFFQQDNESGTDTMSAKGEGESILALEIEPTESRSLIQLLPTAFLIAIAVDAALDGLLIGISTATGDPSTGNILSASLLVESSFLGITIATALRGSSVALPVQACAALIGPVGTITGSILGGLVAPSLSEVGLAALLGFGTSTILFMVAEELLLEAHEEGEDHVWWVDFQLYTGFFASVMVEKLVGA